MKFGCDNLKTAKKLYGAHLHWYIMTSFDNDKATKQFFKDKLYFGYPVSKIHFFMQNKLPLIDTNGKIILQEPYLIKEASNGNGDVFSSMQTNKIITNMKSKKIKWVFFGGIDNVLLKPIDPLFLGLTIDNNLEVGSKSIIKKDTKDDSGVFCKKNGYPYILQNGYITPEMSKMKGKTGNFLYRELNMLAHLFSIDAIQKISKTNLRYHRAFKKNTFLNDEGMKEVPSRPNSFKFEKFIFDSFNLFDNILLLRVKQSEEFAPIKDFTGIYSPETAKKKYYSWRRLWKKENWS